MGNTRPDRQRKRQLDVLARIEYKSTRRKLSSAEDETYRNTLSKIHGSKIGDHITFEFTKTN